MLSNTEAKRWVMFGRQPKDTHGNLKPIPIGLSNKVTLLTQGLEPLSVTEKTQVPQITKSVLEYYANRGNEMANLLLEWSGLEKLRGTFIEGLQGFLQPHPDGTQRLHTGFKQHGTVTGRLSSSKPNLQQLPRGSTDPQAVRCWQGMPVDRR